MPNKRCGAKRKNGLECQQWPIRGRTRCRLHGGKTLFWFAHPNYKTGEYSRYAIANVQWKIRAMEWKRFKRGYPEMTRDPLSLKRPHGRRSPFKKEHVAPVRCGAKNRQGNPCQKWPIKGRNRCRNHGGKSLRGMDSPSFKNGMHSKLSPRDLIARILAKHGL
jgi:hypothetical protein